MTPAVQPDGRGQRVDANLLDERQALEWCAAPIDFARDKMLVAAFFAKMRVSVPVLVASFRADLARREVEIASLRAANATAKRDGWIAGRDKAAAIAEQLARRCKQKHAPLSASAITEVVKVIRVLSPPATEGGRHD